MGQYYKTVFLESDKKTPIAYACAHSVNNGVKLMEHSYIDNSLLNAVLNYMWKNKDAQTFHLVWAGDYADPEEGTEDNIYALIYALSEGVAEIPYETEKPPVRFIVNVDKKQFVDLWGVPDYTRWAAHPLALLTAEGNGRGGGDYNGTSMNLVGTWARDTLTVMGTDLNAIRELQDAGYTELKPDFVEEYELIHAFEKSCKALTKALANDEAILCDSAADTTRELLKELKAALPKKKYPRKK